MSDGKLIVLEGIDKAGTTTVWQKLQDDFPNAFYTREPSDRKYGEFVRESLKDDKEPSPSDFYMFLADRYDHCENVIRPALENGQNVITDRYHLSTYAYQSHILDDAFDMVEPFNYIDDMTGFFVVEPDITLYLDIPLEESQRRMAADPSSDSDKYEDIDRLKEAKRVYDFFAQEKDYIMKVNADRREHLVYHDVREHIEEYI